jgi:hypothetical protein
MDAYYCLPVFYDVFWLEVLNWQLINFTVGQSDSWSIWLGHLQLLIASIFLFFYLKDLFYLYIGDSVYRFAVEILCLALCYNNSVLFVYIVYYHVKQKLSMYYNWKVYLR